VSAAVLLLVAVLMVSRVPTFSVKRLRIKPQLVVPTFIAGIFVTVLLITEVWLMLSLIGLAYLGSIPVSWVMAKRMERAARLEAGAGAAAKPAEQPPHAPTEGSSSESTGSEASPGNATGGERGSVFRIGDRGKQP
jgi:CDP-diacylglycerol---serine O-phosphatidyltransferase